MKTAIIKGVKVEVKRKSKGVRKHIRRMKQAERKESMPAPIKR